MNSETTLNKNSFKSNCIYLLFFAIFAASLLLFCSMCSPLFPYHTRVDQNVFFTVGREILNGKVIYRDMFEHKGPLTYFIHAAAALVSSTSFIGMYIIEIIALTVFMIFAYKTAKLFTNERFALFSTLILSCLILCSGSFLRGDNVEELCLPLLMISMYYTLRSKNQPLSVVFINGLLFGTVFWIKFNLTGYWIGWVLLISANLLHKKEFKKFFISGLIFISGFVMTTVPWIIYFYLEGALYDFVYTYFYCNIFLYKDSTSLIIRLLAVLLGVVRNIIENPVLIAFTVYGFILLFKKRIYSPLLTYAILYLGVFFGGRWYSYYYLILAFYAIFGIIYFLEKFSYHRFLKWVGTHISKGTATITVICVVSAVLFGNCFRYYGLQKDDYVQYKFADYIKNLKIENPTLLNYGFIDQGFYFASDISPTGKYFCRVNISYDALPEMYKEQKSLIDNKEVDFVVVRIKSGKTIEADYYEYMTVPGSGILYIQNPSYAVPADEFPLLFENYELVMEEDDPCDSYRYGLFMKK